MPEEWFSRFFLSLMIILFYIQQIGTSYPIDYEECKFDVKGSLERKYKNKGFHRELVTKIQISESKFVSKVCLLLLEHFPSGIYVDPYQLIHQRAFGGPEVYVSEEVNVETPAYQSSPIDASVFLCTKEEFSEVKLPIHLRYQKPHHCYKNGYFVKIHLGAPSVFAKLDDRDTNHCKNSLHWPCDSSAIRNCSWIPINFTINTPELAFEVPVGCAEHIPIVTIVTLIVVGIGALLLASTLLNHKHFNKQHND